MSVLYVVATPIGNLEDLSPRALRVLKEADLILAEDTRVTRGLLTAFGVRTRLQSCHRHNEAETARALVEQMQKEDLKVALVTDAGTPAVSDPGALLVRAVAQAGVEVLSVPGPSALLAALSVSGFEETEFTFLGFPPRKKGELLAFLNRLSGRDRLAVMYESPRRVLGLMDAVCDVFPEAGVSLSREVSKLHEQTLRGNAREVRDALRADEGLLRGEFCLVLRLTGTKAEPEGREAAGAEARLLALLLEGYTLRQAREALIAAGEKKNRVYKAELSLKRVAPALLPPE